MLCRCSWLYMTISLLSVIFYLITNAAKLCTLHVSELSQNLLEIVSRMSIAFIGKSFVNPTYA